MERGLTRGSLGTADAAISNGLAAEYADYVNAIGLKNPSTGSALTLASTSNGYYQSGSYHEYGMSIINDAVTRSNKYNSASVSTYSTTSSDALYSFVSTCKKASKGLGAFDDYDGKSNPENTLFGIDQGDTHLGTEINLALALQAYSGVKSVDFETIWGLGHTEAEDSGTASANFIAWVEACCGN